MKLTEVLREVEVIEVSGRTDTDMEIAGIACDSRLVKDGFLFVAVRGQKADGHLFIGEAVGRGARAVMCEKGSVTVRTATRIIVSGTRRALARAAANFHANPSKSIGLVGITGTNGKTTVNHLVYNILVSAGLPSGMIGTIEYRIGDEVIAAERTTPDPLVVNSLIARMRAKGCRYVVMEVSSHSLDQHRVGALDFDVAVFTNLSRDHLDYHKTKKNYLQAKALLFESLSPEEKNGFPRRGVICTDQSAGRYIAGRTPVPVLTYGLSGGADVTAEDVRLHRSGSSFTARTPWGSLGIESCLLGRHNVCNILAAVAVGLCQGVEAGTIQRAVRNTPPIPGRLEFIPNGRGYTVVVDYAHTEDALRNVLESLRKITRGKLIVVFGCGGDRDRGKRSKMAVVSSKLADFVVVTSDNPRSEEPMEIISEIVRGFRGRACEVGKGSFTIEPDRREAIAAAISMARDGDTVLIAGKGHETYQEFNGYRVDFDDRKVAREVIESAREEMRGSVRRSFA
ncbi:MAG: UDP-N-acetylmuramoyl-L-alanyl-D-glutamate--2,6-diaminopimelate ligase [Acidobacteriota bacterium]